MLVVVTVTDTRGEMGSCSSATAARVHAFDDTESVPVPPLPKKLTGAFLGLSGAGKSTCIHTLTRQRTKSTQPAGAAAVISPPATTATRHGSVDLDAFTLKWLDVSGDQFQRDTWGPAIHKANFIVFVVDASDVDSLPLAREVLDEILDQLVGECPPVLLLANKISHPKALSVLDAVEELDMRSFDRAYWAVEGCSNVETPDLSHVRDLRQAIIRFAAEAFGAPSESA